MRRTVVLSGIASFIMAFLGTALASTTVVPAVISAQDARLRAERVTVVGDNGADRIDLANGPGVNTAVQVNDAQGVRRAGFNTGGLLAGNDPDGSGFNVWTADGIPVVRLGTGRGPTGDGPLRNILYLADWQGQIRTRLNVDQNGEPSIELLDASGTRRLLVSEGGIDAPDPSSSGITIYAEDGTRVGRLGIGRGPNINLPVSTALTLNDLNGLRRLQLIVEEDGTPSMLMFDANGTVIWSAP
jgi:hypothetical protein